MGTLDGDFFALPEGARAAARVAILNNGFAHNLWRLVLEMGEPADLIAVDFDPATAADQYAVLLIPSGGLYGLENDAAFRARLEEYARRGGVIIAFAQQHGYEYAALPAVTYDLSWTQAGPCRIVLLIILYVSPPAAFPTA